MRHVIRPSCYSLLNLNSFEIWLLDAVEIVKMMGLSFKWIAFLNYLVLAWTLSLPTPFLEINSPSGPTAKCVFHSI